MSAAILIAKDWKAARLPQRWPGYQTDAGLARGENNAAGKKEEAVLDVPGQDRS